jgi:hypothetical protein
MGRGTKFLRGSGTATYDAHMGNVIKYAYLRAFEDFVLKHGRVPNMDILTFQGGFTTTGVVFEICEEVPGE